MKMVNTLKRLVSIFVTIATLLPVAANSATQSSYPTKAAPVAGDKALITDSADGNKTKQATVGSMPISTATQSALDGKETKAVVQASAPADTTVDWYDTDQESGVLILKRHNGTTWLRASSHGVQYLSNCLLIPAGMCVDTDDGKLYYHNGTAVVEVSGGGSFDQAGDYTLSGSVGFTGSVDFTGASVTGLSGGSMTWPASDSAYYAARNGAWTSLAGIFAPALGSDDNYVTDAEKTKLAGIATGAEVNVNADWNASSGDAQILNKPTIPTISDTAYGVSWNGDTGAASKNAIYDKIETIISTDDQTAAEVPATPWGSYTGTNVQALMQEVDTALRSLIGGAALPTWMPSVGPTNGRQILQATGGCSLSAYDNQADCETNSGIWTTPTYQHTSIISGLINDTGTADDDLWSAAKIAGDLAGKQATLGFTPENSANKGAANGYAGLGSDGKVPSSQLPTLGTTYELPSLADAQAGASTTPYVWSPQRVAQAIAALAPSGSAGEGYYEIDGGSSASLTFTGDIDGGASI